MIRYLGIDLGTTNTVAMWTDGEAFHVLPTRSGDALRPSVVWLGEGGEVVVGSAAKEKLAEDPANTHAGFKRLMGTQHELSFPASGRRVTPQELSAMVLRSVVEDAAERWGEPPKRAVITVPALFELPQIAATMEAARQAGLEQIDFLQEPIASGMAAAWRRGQHAERWLVFDLGGGTFDISVVAMVDGIFRVVGHEGDNFLGGRDMDANLADIALDRLRSGGLDLDRGDPRHARGLRRLEHACEQARIALGSAPHYDLVLPRLFELHGERVDVAITFTAADLERACEPIVSRCLSICDHLLASLRRGSDADAIDLVVPVGGPTQAPALRRALRRHFTAPVHEDADPMLIVAQGAAIMALHSQLEATGTVGSRQKATHHPDGRPLDVRLAYTPLTADPKPFVVASLSPEVRTRWVRLRRDSDGWCGAPMQAEADGSVYFTVPLETFRCNTFIMESSDNRSTWTPLSGGVCSITHGLSASAPPLSRSLGVGTRDDRVRVLLPRGKHLPAQVTTTMQVADHILPQDASGSLIIPVVQGESSRASRCRTIGALEIGSAELQQALRPGDSVDITLEVDGSGCVQTTARVVRTGQIFGDVLRLQSAGRNVDELRDAATDFAKDLGRVRRDALTLDIPDREVVEALDRSTLQLNATMARIRAAEGGDLDAQEQAHRSLLEISETLDRLSDRLVVPAALVELSQAIDETHMMASQWGWPNDKLAHDFRQIVDQEREARRHPPKDVTALHLLTRKVRALSTEVAMASEPCLRTLLGSLRAEAHNSLDPQALHEILRQADATRDLRTLQQLAPRALALLPPSAGARHGVHFRSSLA